MYNWLDENTEETEYLSSSGICVWFASNTITTIARVAGIGEVFLKGSGLLLSAPFTDNRIHNATFGLHEVFVHTPKNILRTTLIPIEFILGTLFIAFEPKHFTMEMSECMRINLHYAKAGTIHSAEHKKELSYMQGRIKPKFMEYQERRWERLESKV